MGYTLGAPSEWSTDDRRLNGPRVSGQRERASTGGHDLETEIAQPRRAPVLDPIDRVSEAMFGVLMAVSITGSLSVASAGYPQIRSLMLTAVGCNLAWGFTDAVMYLLGASAERTRQIALLSRLQLATDLGAAHRMIADDLPDRISSGLSEPTLEGMRKDLVALRAPHGSLAWPDYLAAIGVFLVVVVVTLPVVIPFLLIRNVPIAMRVSNATALAILYLYGHLLGTYTNRKPMHFGLAFASLGAILVAIIMALGG
jgi:hypothetical protein